MNPAPRVPRHGLEHPAFSLLEPSVRARLLALDHFPFPHELRELARGVPNAITPWFDFAEQDPAELQEAGGFDRLLQRTRAVPTRAGSFHDLFGALIWLHFPALKTVIHHLQLEGHSSARSPVQNALTHLDESGVLVLSSDEAIFRAITALEWADVFWHKRGELQQTTRFLVFGHGLLDALRDPHPRLMGKALFARVTGEHLALTDSEFRVFVDGALARLLPGFLSEPARLLPLPVLGVPGWSAQQTRSYYDDERYFRSVRQRVSAPSALSTPSAPAWLVLD
ncbi:MAG TPA: DUF3025 domain-containing protein [Polyangiaceae bacterium]|nr:DUF3025 domain-containing protein [Polyangiaceae bacterium]